MKNNKLLTALAIIFAMLCLLCVVFALYPGKKPKSPLPSEILTTKAAETFTESIKYHSPIDFDSIKK